MANQLRTMPKIRILLCLCSIALLSGCGKALPTGNTAAFVPTTAVNQLSTAKTGTATLPFIIEATATTIPETTTIGTNTTTAAATMLPQSTQFTFPTTITTAVVSTIVAPTITTAKTTIATTSNTSVTHSFVYSTKATAAPTAKPTTTSTTLTSELGGLPLDTSIIIKKITIDGSAGSKGILYQRDNISLPRGATALDALAKSGISYKTSGNALTDKILGSYVSEIAGLREFDFGGTSGWKYYVNGIAPDTASNKYTLNGGDVLEWRYVLEV